VVVAFSQVESDFHALAICGFLEIFRQKLSLFVKLVIGTLFNVKFSVEDVLDRLKCADHVLCILKSNGWHRNPVVRVAIYLTAHSS
jgi:hypothetical protein